MVGDKILQDRLTNAKDFAIIMDSTPDISHKGIDRFPQAS